VLLANKTFLCECSLTNGCLVNISFIGEFQPLDDKNNEKKSSVTHTKDFCWEIITFDNEFEKSTLPKMFQDS
jgi:hypothetical protein